MFNIGTWELILILALALILLGPKKLPEVARSLGKGLLQLRRSLDEVKREIDIDGIRRDIESEVGLDELRQTLDVRADVRRALDELERQPELPAPNDPPGRLLAEAKPQSADPKKEPAG